MKTLFLVVLAVGLEGGAASAEPPQAGPSQAPVVIEKTPAAFAGYAQEDDCCDEPCCCEKSHPFLDWVRGLFHHSCECECCPADCCGTCDEGGVIEGGTLGRIIFLAVPEGEQKPSVDQQRMPVGQPR